MLVLLADLQDLRYLGRGAPVATTLAQALDALLARELPPLLRVEIFAADTGAPENEADLKALRRFPAPLLIHRTPKVLDKHGEVHGSATRALLRASVSTRALSYLIHRPNRIEAVAFSWGDPHYLPALTVLQEHGIQTAVLGEPHALVVPLADLIVPLTEEKQNQRPSDSQKEGAAKEVKR